MNPFDWLAKIFGTGLERSPDELQRLRTEFVATVGKFKQLISANRKALDAMARMETALESERPLGISYVRSCYSQVSTNVYEMVRLLDEIIPDKYETLFSRFEYISGAIAPFFALDPISDSAPRVLTLSGMDRSACGQVGDKMANLAEIGTHLGLKTPAGFVITRGAYWDFIRGNRLQEQIDEILGTMDHDQTSAGIDEQSSQIRSRILGASVPDALGVEILAHYNRLEQEYGEGVSIAVRSSALGEDKPGASCAGMYKTVLGATGENLLDAYKEVIASKYSTNSMVYRMNNGIRHDEVAMCVGCMPLITAVCGGVVYTRNPLDALDETISIHSVFGLPGLVVEGGAHSDVFTVSRDNPPKILERDIAIKQISAVPTGNAGVTRVRLLIGRKKEPSIDDNQALELARQVLKIEHHFGAAQDVEWAVDESGAIIFLQSRPLLLPTDSKAEQASEDDTKEPGDVLATGDVTASSGAAAGPVFIVRQEKDLSNFPEGAVLVVRQPLPDWISALRRASAVIAEQGSVAGHLANVARELHVPALFRVNEATKRFENEDIVTVHASRKKVYGGRIESLTNSPVPRRHALEGTPVYKALKGIAEHTTPLTLIDPDDEIKFRPRNCATLHDITRFCHEKALREMFRFGAERRFPERAARRLYVRRPSQFWVIDFADGFKTDTRSKKYIRLDEIESMPMHAIWDGMMTIPWEVPRVNARGLFGVLMESTTNPGLNPSLPSPYSQRNYFMISKEYCSCQTRFGYHFSTVEALVGESRQENYISFNFRGGAASKHRRINRARLVASILEGQDLRVQIDGDSVHAHVEKFDASFLRWRLNVIGYIMFHTRQLDMVLTDNNAIEHYKRKMEKDLEVLRKKCSLPRGQM